VSENGTAVVEGTDSEGALFYRMEFDPDPDADPATLLGNYTLTVFQDPPEVVTPLDFSVLKAGGPQEDVTVQNIGFDGGFFTAGAGLFASFNDVGIPNNSDDFINPNNAGGIGIGNGNIERLEVLEIDVSGSSGVTAMELDVQGVGGGIGFADVLWEAVSGGVVVDSGSIDDLDFSSKDAHTIQIDPDMDFDLLYVALDPYDIDGNDKVRINKISTVKEEAAEDILLGFRINSDDPDGDHSPAEAAVPSYEEVVVTVEGTNGGTPIVPDIVVA
ncbi:MAG: hypothetical protein R3215_08730, partial [Halomonas sp.]|nr:hypothetical protein [Halomonas sp.]